MGDAVSGWASSSFGGVEWLAIGLSWIGYFFSAPIAIFVAWLISAIIRPVGNRTWLAPERARFQEVAYRIWNARYCSRDDVMFYGEFAASPELFKIRAYERQS